MTYEFQVIYRQGGRLFELPVRADSEDDARRRLKAAKVKIVSVGKGFPIVDWEKRAFTNDEAAVALGEISVSGLGLLVGKGVLPDSKDGRKPLFPRRVIEQVIAKRMGLRLREIEEAADSSAVTFQESNLRLMETTKEAA